MLATLSLYVPVLQRYLVVPDLALLLAAVSAGLVILVKGTPAWLAVMLACLYLPGMYLAILYLEAWAGGVMRGTSF